MLETRSDISEDDRFLMQEFARGKEYALELLITRYHGALSYLAALYFRDPSQADPLVTEVFVTLWFCRRQFASLADVEVFLYKYVTNASVRALRRLRQSGALASTVIDNLTAAEIRDLIEYNIFETRVLVEAEQLLQSTKHRRKGKGKTGRHRRSTD